MRNITEYKAAKCEYLCLRVSYVETFLADDSHKCIWQPQITGLLQSQMQMKSW